MTKKKLKPKYRVKIFVKAMLEVEVDAHTPEAAIKNVNEMMNTTKFPFTLAVDVVDSTTIIAGYDDERCWEQLNG